MFNGFIAGSVKGTSCMWSVFYDRYGEKHEDAYVHADIKMHLHYGKADQNIADKTIILPKTFFSKKI